MNRLEASAERNSVAELQIGSGHVPSEGWKTDPER